MGFLKQAIDVFLHLDRHLQEVLQAVGGWTYLVLFLVVFCETGLVVTPVLPGDSLLFAAGTFAALGSLDVTLLFALLGFAAIAGDTANYWIGRKLGPKVFSRETRFLNKKHLERTHAFYERHGGKTIIIARFVPIVRTFAPFVAGIGAMTYGRFITYNVIGGLAWVGTCTFAGYFFGNIPWVRAHFSVVVIAIVLLSVLPAVVEILREQQRNRRERARPESAS